LRGSVRIQRVLALGEEIGAQYNPLPPAITLVHALMEKVQLVECNAGESARRPLYSVAGESARRKNVKNSVKNFFHGESSHEKLHAKSAVRRPDVVCSSRIVLWSQHTSQGCPRCSIKLESHSATAT